MDYQKEALRKHREWAGLMEIFYRERYFYGLSKGSIAQTSRVGRKN